MTNEKGMTNEEVINYFKRSYASGDTDDERQHNEALDMAIKAIDKISHLIDRPCEACEFHKENGCCKWSCVFEEVEE